MGQHTTRAEDSIKVLVVDDHDIVREGISTVLGLYPEIEVVGEAANGYEALDMLHKHGVDVVLMDIIMPAMNGLEATRRICKEFPGLRVIALSQYSDKEHVLQIIESGAKGFISKSHSSSELISGIRAVYHGDSYLSPQVAKYLVEDFQQEEGTEKQLDAWSQLTEREREILKLLADGRTTQEIAEFLVISPKTVEGHKTRLMSKLDLRNRVDLVKYALKKGITTY